MAATATLLTEKETQFLKELGQQLRIDSIRCSTAAGSGHPTSSMSAANVIAVLLTRHLLYDWHNPKEPANDHLIYSKGHASPLCYAMFKAAGVITDLAAPVPLHSLSTQTLYIRWDGLGPKQRVLDAGSK